MSNAHTPAMMAQSMAESLFRENARLKKIEESYYRLLELDSGDVMIDTLNENDRLKEQNAMLTVQVQRHQWQPIETAPRDGTPVDLWHKSGGRIPETWWDEEDQCWSCVMDDDCFSHWMPMPEVPGISALPKQVKSDARDGTQLPGGVSNGLSAQD